MANTLVQAIPDPDTDVLAIHGTGDAGHDVTATGWVSATSNHFDPSAYGADGDGNLTRDPNAQPRAMTQEEVRAYCQGLLDAASPAPLEAPPPANAITF